MVWKIREFWFLLHLKSGDGRQRLRESHFNGYSFSLIEFPSHMEGQEVKIRNYRDEKVE